MDESRDTELFQSRLTRRAKNEAAAPVLDVDGPLPAINSGRPRGASWCRLSSFS